MKGLQVKSKNEKCLKIDSFLSGEKIRKSDTAILNEGINGLAKWIKA